MKKLISLFTSFSIILAPLSSLANPIGQWEYYGDNQQDSLPTPGGEFEITGIAVKEDLEFVYIAIQANKDLLTGVSFKTAKIFSGDLFINEFGIRTSPLNNSGLEYGSIYNNLTYKSVAPFVFGQSSISEYESKIRKLGQIPYNGSYSSDIPGELADSGEFVSKIEIVSPIEANLPQNLGENLLIVKIPKSLFPDLNLNISFSLECLNDIISITHSLNPTPEVDVPVDISEPISSFSFQGLETPSGEFPILEASATSVAVILLLLLMGGEDDIIKSPDGFIPVPPDVPGPNPVNTPDNSSILTFLLGMLFIRKNENKKI